MAEQLRGGVCLHGLEVAGAYRAGKKIGLGKAGSLLLPALGRNLITNGDFETGDMTGWKTKGNNVIQTRENSKNIVEPHGGDYLDHVRRPRQHAPIVLFHGASRYDARD